MLMDNKGGEVHESCMSCRDALALYGQEAIREPTLQCCRLPSESRSKHEHLQCVSRRRHLDMSAFDVTK